MVVYYLNPHMHMELINCFSIILLYLYMFVQNRNVQMEECNTNMKKKVSTF